MKKPKIKSIYARFVLIFLSIWWILNGVTFGAIIYYIEKSSLAEALYDVRLTSEEFHSIRLHTGLIFFVVFIIGAIIILITVKKIVKPVKELSNASKEIAKGNFDIQLTKTTNDEIGELISDFNIMAKELYNIDTIHKDFVNNVSHEFRTPITAIKGYAKLIKNDDLSKEKKEEYSDIIISESERLVNLSSDLLKLSELDNKEVNYQPINFSLDEQIRKAILFLEPLWNKKNINFELNLEKITYLGTENLLWQVWINLIGNAIKFSKDKGIIYINLLNEEEYVKFEIIDHGIGIPEEDIPKIFDHFYKSDKSRSSEGNGLGLAIVKKIINTIEGTLEIESIPKKETKVTIRLIS